MSTFHPLIHLLGHNGEEAIPMLMLNHSDSKPEAPPLRARAPSIADNKVGNLIGGDSLGNLGKLGNLTDRGDNLTKTTGDKQDIMIFISL